MPDYAEMAGEDTTTDDQRPPVAAMWKEENEEKPGPKREVVCATKCSPAGAQAPFAKASPIPQGDGLDWPRGRVTWKCESSPQHP